MTNINYIIRKFEIKDRAALRKISCETSFLVHYKSYPLPRGHHPEKELLPPDIYKNEISWESSFLNADEVVCKENALKKHHSQVESAAEYLDAFIKKNELFGDFVKVKIDATISPAYSYISRKAELATPPEELIDDERASFVGIQEHSVSINNDNIIFSLSLSRSLAKEVGLSVYLFGYKQGVPFARMPKIHVRFGYFFQAVYDQNKKIAIPNSGIILTRQRQKITISIPLQLLGNPERILTSANTYLGKIPLDWVSWRIIEIPPRYPNKI